MDKYIVNTEEEFWDMFEEQKLELSNLFIDTCFKFLDENPNFNPTEPKEYEDIIIMSVFIREISDYGDVMLNPLDILDVLEENLITQEEFENYEMCAKIKSTIESLTK
jgi:hypothetical protein